MTFDAIVLDMDFVWENREEALIPGQRQQTVEVKRLLENVRAEGYPLMLVSEMTADRLNAAITGMLGDDGVNYFSSILSARAQGERYQLALHTLATPAHRIAALGNDEQKLTEARASGIAHCFPLADALKQGFIPVRIAALPD